MYHSKHMISTDRLKLSHGKIIKEIEKANNRYKKRNSEQIRFNPNFQRELEETQEDSNPKLLRSTTLRETIHGLEKENEDGYISVKRGSSKTIDGDSSRNSISQVGIDKLNHVKVQANQFDNESQVSLDFNGMAELPKPRIQIRDDDDETDNEMDFFSNRDKQPSSYSRMLTNSTKHKDESF